MLFYLAVVLPGSAAIAQGNTQPNPNEVITHSDSVIVHSYLTEAAAAQRAGDIQRQRNLLDRAYDAADSLDVSSLIKSVEKDLGEYYLDVTSYDSAQTVLERAAGRSSGNNLHAEVLNYLGTAYLFQSQYPKAMSTYNHGLALIDSLEVPSTYMALNTNKAGIYERFGNISEAISIYQRGIDFAETIGDSSFLATALNNLGKIYFEQESFDESIPYLEEAIAVSEKQDFFTTLLRAKHNLASTNRDLGNYKEARKLYQEAWDLHNKIRPDSPPIQLLFNMGRWHFLVGDLDEAEEHFSESFEYSKNTGLPPGMFHNLIGFGDIAKKRGNISASADHYKKALDIANQIKSPPLEVAASEKLYELHKSNGNYAEALSFYERATHISDSLSKTQQDQQLALAETELGLRQQQQLNQLLQERQKQQEARINIQNWLMGISALVIVIILIAIYVLYRTNEERKRANRELAELNEVKDKMMAVIAHDLRSPMASTQGVLHLLKDGDISREEVREIAAELEVTISQNINMMDNLLNWTQSQMKGLETNIQVFPAHEVADDALDNCQLQAKHKSVTLENKIPEDVDIKADPDLMKLIVRNLVNNAIKFSNEGDTVTVEAEVDNGAVVLKVKDTGIGIPQEQQEHIFSIAGHSRSGTQNEKGSGLGLQLCKEFTEKQNGVIRLDSTEGEGTVFYINLPKGDN